VLKSWDRDVSELLLCITVALATFAIAPWAYDPINVPKLAFITIGAFCSLVLIIFNLKCFWDSKLRVVGFWSLVFILYLIIVFIVSGTNPIQEFFGAFGRSTGLLAYVSLTILMTLAALAASMSLLKKLMFVLIGAGALSVFYGILQSIGADPIKWVSGYSPVIGFFGNPNFMSSFVAISGTMSFALSLNREFRLKKRIVFVLQTLVSIYVILETRSQQGFFVLGFGILIISLTWISKSQVKSFFLPSVFVSGTFLIMAILGSINKGPFSSVLFKDSVIYRGDYWRAGWEMALSKPFFGVGLDSYGDWYRRTRTLEATIRRGPEIVTNASHNVVIDFLANGGFLLALIYVILLCIVLTAAVRLIKRSQTFDPFIVGLVAVWFGYQAQSIISINQLAMAVWGWVLSGLIIGLEVASRPKSKIELPSKPLRQGRVAISNTSGGFSGVKFLNLVLFLVFGTLLGAQPLAASSSFATAIQSGNASLISEASNVNPQMCEYKLIVGSILANNGLKPEAMKVLVKGAEIRPDCFELWQLISQIAESKTTEYKEAVEQMKRLDPLNPTLK
jgi:O-antigen ligase